MQNENFTATFLVDQTPKEAFDAINNVKGWWTENMDGDSEKLNDEFSVRFWDLHYSTQRLTEVITDAKVVWMITDSTLTFLKQRDEWTGSRVVFEVAGDGKQTRVTFTHVGLTSESECYGACSNGWNTYIQSLQQLITTGAGKPEKREWEKIEQL